MEAVDAKVRIHSEADIVSARQASREIALQVGFGATDMALIATAVSELTRNIWQYAGDGCIEMHIVEQGSTKGISIVAHDDGPGIPDTEMAMRDGFSTGGGLGLGLPGTRRMMDDFELTSGPGKGTTVAVVKWLR
ncbi:MAG: anti-sigma regulatory factor [Dehalococcoidia bacterium]|jgi:serine/threonine-protein kinase RsbT